MNLNGIRKFLYGSGSVLGDVKAVQKAVERKSLGPLLNRASNRVVWKLGTQVLRALTRRL